MQRSTQPESLPDLSEGAVSQLKMTAKKQDWDQVVQMCRDEQQKRTL